MSDQQGGKKYFRWRYYIDRKFQNVFILRFSAIVVLVVGFTLGMLWLLGENPYALLSEEGGLLWSVSAEKTVACVRPDGGVDKLPLLLHPFNAFQLFWRPIVFVSGLNLLLVILFSLFYSHSMAGPIHKMRMELRDMASGGTIRPIRVRKNDQFQELVDDLNLLIEKRVK